MTLLLKDPEAALDYGVDWGRDYLSDDSIETSGWTVTPTEPGGLIVVAERHDFATASAELEGGVAGHVYRLTNRIVTAAGRSDARSFTVRVEQR